MRALSPLPTGACHLPIVNRPNQNPSKRDYTNMILISHLFPLGLLPTSNSQTAAAAATATSGSLPPLQLPILQSKHAALLSHLLSVSIAVTLSSPLPCSAIPSLNNSPPSPSLPTTPFSQAKNLQLGLENGKIRACPAINPGCISTNARSSSFAFPWRIPPGSGGNAIQKLQEAILKTQKNAKIQVVEDISAGQYLQAEVDGGFGRDVLEFLVKGDVVAYRCMAAKITYVYPFTTAFGDSKGQEERMKIIVNQLGWDAPSFDSMD